MKQELKIELDAPNVSGLEKERIHETIDSGFVSTFGPFVPRFENRIAEYLGAKKAVSTQSGTTAIHIALYELGIGPGDEVIVPALTFVATVNPIIYVGATPVFVDVDVKTWNIDLEDVERKITERTKAIIPVHLYGNPCKIDELVNMARERGIYVIEDVTESLGAKYKKVHTGTFGDFGCLSFNGNKVITTGGGGMIVGNDAQKLDHIKFLLNQARDESREYYHPEIGFNGRMTNIEAALGLAQMERLNFFLVKKKNFNNIYKKELKDAGFIDFQKEYEDAHSSCWLSCIICEKDDIDITLLQKRLKDNGIPTRRVFMPVTEFPPYKKFKKTALDKSYHIYERSLCLPSSTLNSEDDIYYVCSVLKNKEIYR